MTVATDHLEQLADRLARLTRETEALIRTAQLDREGKALVSLSALNRVARELRNEPQPSSAWMSS